MGLDMYLTGRKYLWTSWENPEQDRMEDGHRIKAVELELGYWRKHPNLHGYIVKTFADGVDECQDIELDVNALVRILAASEGDELPDTRGFFFGQSTAEDKASTKRILEGAIAWFRAGSRPPVTVTPVASFGPFSVAEVTPLKHEPEVKAGQQQTRSVIYRASW